MANRLSKIVTRGGDDGSTGLADGTRVSKNSARIATIGDIDELNSHLGLLLSEELPATVRQDLLLIQNDLFDLGATLALPGTPFSLDKLARLDVAIAHYNADLPPLKEFILPGGTRAAALCHVARCEARRTERGYFHLARSESVSNDGLRYLNRLSDLLFILARAINRAADHAETLWQRS